VLFRRINDTQPNLTITTEKPHGWCDKFDPCFSSSNDDVDTGVHNDADTCK